ncbi:MAG: ABC transporter substrate-binding protein, partial [Actinomycetota bacterium]|nr:ABC transporter substrate-binding protein [Actinomycetota bacterium]
MRSFRSGRFRASLVGAAVVVLALAGCGGGDDEDPPAAGGTGDAAEVPDLGEATIVLGGKVITWIAPYVGACEGLFENYGLTVDVVPSEQGTTSAIAGLVSGDVLTAGTGATAMTNAVREGAPIQMLFNASIGYGVQVIMSNDFLESSGASLEDSLEERVQALEGARIAILNPGDSIDQLLRYLLPEYGLDPDTDVTITALSNYPNMIAALSQGDIDVMAGSPPNGAQVEQEGFGQILFNGNEVEGLDDYPYLVGSANVQAIEGEEREAIKALIKGIADTLDLLREDPDAGKECMQAEFPDLE